MLHISQPEDISNNPCVWAALVSTSAPGAVPPHPPSGTFKDILQYSFLLPLRSGEEAKMTLRIWVSWGGICSWNYVKGERYLALYREDTWLLR